MIFSTNQDTFYYFPLISSLIYLNIFFIERVNKEVKNLSLFDRGNCFKQVFVLRKSTEHPEAVESGYTDVVGTDYAKAMKVIDELTKNPVVPKGKSHLALVVLERKLLKSFRKLYNKLFYLE
ncbi:MAG: hypothetical protein U9O98_09965 [Asgard group archaeon]|nr:hypothetical protein [Asgard group archaeon]